MNITNIKEALRQFDLPSYLEGRYPGCKDGTTSYASSQRRLYLAVWRGEKRPSFSVFQGTDGKWRWQDFATSQHGDSLDFIKDIEGISNQEALGIVGVELDDISPVAQSVTQKKAKEGKYIPPPHPLDTLRPSECDLGPLAKSLAHQYAASVKELQEGTGFPTTLLERGYSIGTAKSLGLGRSGNDTYIPIRQWVGEEYTLVNVKMRKHDESKGRYRYLRTGGGSPAWHSPDLWTAETGVIVVEGELNAMAVWMEYRKSGFGVVGVAGSSGNLSQNDIDVIMRIPRPVYTSADRDVVGHMAAVRWAAQTEGTALGAMLGGDACHWWEQEGSRGIHRRMDPRLRSANQLVAELLSGQRSRTTMIAKGRMMIMAHSKDGTGKMMGLHGFFSEQVTRPTMKAIATFHPLVRDSAIIGEELDFEQPARRMWLFWRSQRAAYVFLTHLDEYVLERVRASGDAREEMVMRYIKEQRAPKNNREHGPKGGGPGLSASMAVAHLGVTYSVARSVLERFTNRRIVKRVVSTTGRVVYRLVSTWKQRWIEHLTLIHWRVEKRLERMQSYYNTFWERFGIFHAQRRASKYTILFVPFSVIEG